MTKRQIIDDILLLNRSAKAEFLAQFDNDELTAYLQHLQSAQTPRLSGAGGMYDRYFQDLPVVSTRQADEPDEAHTLSSPPHGETTPLLFDTHTKDTKVSPVPVGPGNRGGVDTNDDL